VTAVDLGEIMAEVCRVFDARRAELVMRFKYFLDKQAPATGSVSSLDYDCEFHGAIADGDYQFTLGVTVPVMTLCPCSKEISGEGAHSQRALVTVRLRTRPGTFVWIEDLVPLIEGQGSSGLFPILKRADEKAVTEAAYARPKFVEDVVRDTILALRGLEDADWYSAECVSFESIHNHNAYAFAAESRPSPGDAPGTGVPA
jgi:GTP cyclohydrolase I